MKKILILGQNPSRSNLFPNVPFVGTKSGEILFHWIVSAGIVGKYELHNVLPVIGSVSKRDVRIQMANSKTFLCMLHGKTRIIAVGRIAEYAIKIKKADIPLLYVPHPSGLNRILNEPGKEEEIINNIRNFCRGVL